MLFGEPVVSCCMAVVSSCREMLGSRNERNPYPSYQRVMSGTLARPPIFKSEEGGDDVKSSWPYVQGYTRATMVGTNRCELARGSQSEKTDLSTDKSLQLDSLKSESLVIADQQAAVNTFPGLVHTARHTMGVVCSRSA